MFDNIPALWSCPACGRQFAHRNQRHSCAQIPLEAYLDRKMKPTVRLFKTFESMARALGPLRLHVNHERVAFIAENTFAETKLNRSFLEIYFFLPYRSTDPRFERYYPCRQGGAHGLRIRSRSDFDSAFQTWLKDAYTAASQNEEATLPHPPKTKARVFLIHWKKEEAEEIADSLRRHGHEVRTHSHVGHTLNWDGYAPDVFVVSLERLPSHGRAWAEWFWEAEKRRSTPLIFSGGAPHKTSDMKKQFHQAIFCSTAELPDAVHYALSTPDKTHR